MFIEKGCMDDFKYITTLLPLNGQEKKDNEDLRVLREGTQCRLFGGKYGITHGKGRGVIALEDIEKDTFIFEYAGTWTSKIEMHSHYASNQSDNALIHKCLIDCLLSIVSEHNLLRSKGSKH